MTKVNLTVTKNLADVPSEISSQLDEVASKIEELLRKVHSLKSSVENGIAIKMLPPRLAEMSEELDPVSYHFQDIYNICTSYSGIEKQQEEQKIEEEIEKRLAGYKFEIEAKVGQLAANEKLLSDQIRTLTSRLESVGNSQETKLQKKKTTKKTKT